MITFRWMVLRLFWALLALIPVAFFVLWFVHAYLLPQSNIFDEVIVALLGAGLFALASYFLTREAERRFQYLQQRGRALLEANREADMPEIFALLLQLQQSGLLSENRKRGMQRELMRTYFPFYAEHPERRDFQAQLVLALHDGVRPQEAYHVLKSYILQRVNLTLEATNLAEELLDHHPEDESLIGYFVEQFLRDQKSHYRAEYFYAKYLARSEGPLTDEILALCLPKILRHPRRDDFAAWSLVRAFDRAAASAPAVRRALYELQQSFQKSRRQDRLAQELAARAAQITPAERAAGREAAKGTARKTTSARLAQWRWQWRQWIWDLRTGLRPYQREITIAALALVLLGIVYFTRPFSFSGPPAPAAPAASAVDDTTHYFSLQVIALKDKRSAESAADLLQRRRLDVYVLEPRAGRGWYRVRVGRYPSMQHARLAADSLKAAGLIDDYFVTNYEPRP